MIRRDRFSKRDRAACAALWALAAAAFSTEPANAQDMRPLPPPPAPSDVATGTEFKPSFVLDTGRVAASEGSAPSFQMHGEYQLRLLGASALPLAVGGGLPSRFALSHWLRLTPRARVFDGLDVIGQIDVPRGFIAGQRLHSVDSARAEDYTEHQPFGVDPRWLYVEWRARGALLRAGQQPSHWGMGIVANDGDHPSVFGDYAGGDRVERLLFALQPGGAGSPFTLELAGDLVFKDAHADLTDGEHAFQAVLAAYYADKREDRVGFYGVYRHQRQDGPDDRTLTETVALLDSAGQFNAKIPGVEGHVFGEYEAAYWVGQSDFTRLFMLPNGAKTEDVRAFGLASRMGFVTTAGRGADRFGRLVAQIEWGWASADAAPDDGTYRTFRFNPNHKVGLVLFDQVLAWKLARARAVARSANQGSNAGIGVEQLPSDGAVVGASYVNPTLLVRPMRTLDLKAGIVVAQMTSDFLDASALVPGGAYQNFDGGSPHARDLGVELDAGFEYRYPLRRVPLVAQLGAQGGVLFPGRAFDDAAGGRMRTEYVAIGRAGFQY